MIYSQIEVEPRSNITLVLKMAGLAILRREFFYSIKEEMEMNYEKYKRFETIKLKDRTWPDKTIEKAPIWCSVDLRDGNQALITPMKIEEKVEMFQLLVDLGFKEIEVGFPSSSQIEYDFLRLLIEENLIPDDVTVQVLTQAREHLIRKTFEALKGLDKAIVHVYNSTSILQRDVVFNKDKDEIKQIAIDGVQLVKDLSKEFEGKVILEYSPESFTELKLIMQWKYVKLLWIHGEQVKIIK